MADGHGASQPQPIAPATGSNPGFFTTLLSPLYGTPRTTPQRSSSANVDGNANSATAPLFGSYEERSGRSRSSNAATPSLSPTTAVPDSRQTVEHVSGPLSLSSPHEGHNSGSAPRLKHGFMQSPLGTANSAVSAGERHKLARGDGLDGVSTSSPSSSSASRKGSAHALPPPPPPPPPPMQVNTQQQQQHGSGACAPHMLGYRQCLEVNPDFKTNCTWALDNYMRCKEDTEL